MLDQDVNVEHSKESTDEGVKRAIDDADDENSHNGSMEIEYHCPVCSRIFHKVCDNKFIHLNFGA